MSEGSRAGSDRSGSADGALAPDVRSLVALSAALATRNERALESELVKALSAAAPESVEEALIQSYLFLGYPATLNALAVWRELSGRDAPQAGPRDLELWERRGEEICRTVYGDQYRALRSNVRALHPDMEKWMVAEGYGKVLGRPGLALRVRELCIVALLAVLDTPVQLYSHLRGSLNVGASIPEVDEALEVASGYMDDAARQTARTAWSRARARRES